MTITIAVLVVLAIIGWLRLEIDTSVEPLLPESNQARKALVFLRDSSFASKAVLWFRRTDGKGTAAAPGRKKDDGKPPATEPGTQAGAPEPDPLAVLYAAADAVERKLDPKLIKRVIHPPREADLPEELLGLLDHAGELLTADDLADLDSLSAPDALSKRMRECYLQLLKPEGSVMQPVIRRDPLGVNMRILARFRGLSEGMGYKVAIKDGRFVHSDGRQLLLIVEASSSATNLAGSEALAAHLQALCAEAPKGVEILPICAQIHTAQNHQLMARDMKYASVIDAVAFVLLFLVVRRDWRVGAVFLLPLVTIAITIGLCALVFPKLSAIVMGMSVTMAGSAVDYGIFVFTALWLGSDPKADVRRMRKPLVISHLTTLGVFFAFLFSDIPAYRQLGWMTSLSLILSLLGALFVLPALLRPGGKVMALRRGMPLERWGRKMIPVVAAAGVLLAVGTMLAARVSFDSDITRMDGVSPAVRQGEKDFQRTWGRSDTEMAILVVTGKTRDDAEQLNDKINGLMAGKITQGRYLSLSAFWPSAATRHASLARWRQYWSDQRVADLRRKLATAGAPLDFSARAFEPFFQSLASPPQEETARQILSSIEEQFIARSGSDWQMLNYFEDTPENVAAAAALAHDFPDAQVVSRSAISDAFAKSAVSETNLLVSISVVFIVGSLLLLTRSAIKSLIMMLPAITGIIGMLAVMAMMSMTISVITVVAGIFVLALASDYGIFAVFAWDRGESLFGQGMASVHLSSVTTLVGSGALLLALHPATFLVGVSLTSGLLVGYLTAFLVIPGICFLLERRKQRRAM